MTAIRIFLKLDKNRSCHQVDTLNFMQKYRMLSGQKVASETKQPAAKKRQIFVTQEREKLRKKK